MYKQKVQSVRHIVALLFSVSLLFVCHLLQAQNVKVSPSNTPGPPEIEVYVLNELTALESAVVEIYTPSDTLHGVTCDLGAVTFPNRHKNDSVLLKVSYLGYKPVLYKTRITLSRPVFFVEMQEDTTQLNAIIIKDDAIAMVVHGDTTIFNAAAFNMRDKDPLGKLLEKLPGITIENGEIKANGQKVSKILINGKSLFGNNVNAAMDMIYSEDVKKVRIYDEHDQDRLIEADTLKMKERVVDVVTNRHIDYVRGYQFRLSAGAFTDNGKNDKTEWLAGGDASYGQFGKDVPEIGVNAKAEKNIKDATPSSSPEINAKIFLNISKRNQRKSKFDNNVTIDYSDRSSETMSSDIYSPSDSYNTRQSDYTELYSDKTLKVNYYGTWEHSVAEKNIFHYSLNGNYNGIWYDKAQLTKSVIDENTSITDGRIYNRNNSGSVKGSISWKRLMSRPGREFSMSCGYNGNFGNGEGTRKTDSPNVLLMQNLVDSSSTRNHRVYFSSSFTEPLAKRFSFTVSYNLEGLKSFSRRIAWDEILNAVNSINTHEYTHYEIRNTINAGLTYRLPEEGIFMSLSLKYRNISQLRKETLPMAAKSPDSYNYIGPDLYFSYNPGTCLILVRYYENAAPPSIEQKRNAIDDSNPLFLVGGNPGLKLPVIRTVNMRTSFYTQPISTHWSIDATYNECSNSIVNKVTFFKDATTLEQYDGYKASAGSQLSQPVNVNGNRNFTGKIGAEIFSKPLKSTVTPSVSYSFAQNPFFQQEERLDNVSHDIGFGLSYRSSFSKYFSLNISNHTAIGRSMRNGEKVYDRINETVTARAEANFLKRMVVTTDVVYDMFRTDSGFGDYDKVLLNAAAGVHLDKQEKSTIWLKGCDLLGNNRNNQVSISDLYVRSRYSTILGRCVFLSYQYRF